MKPTKHQRSKQRCRDLCWKVHDPAQSFVLHSLRNQNIWLVPRSVVSQGQNENKNTTQNFVEFHKHSALLTIMQVCGQPALESKPLRQFEKST